MQTVLDILYHPAVWIISVLINAALFVKMAYLFRGFLKNPMDVISGYLVASAMCLSGVVGTAALLLIMLLSRNDPYPIDDEDEK